MKPAGLQVVRRFANADLCRSLMEEVDKGCWSEELKRRVQHFGYRYNYGARRVSRDVAVPQLPGWAVELSQDIVASGYAPSNFDQVIVNEYLPGQGISPHIDSPAFEDVIASLSLGSSIELVFLHPETSSVYPVLLNPGDLTVMQGEARYDWQHAIKARKADWDQGKKIVRGRRVSLTFRKIQASAPA